MARTTPTTAVLLLLLLQSVAAQFQLFDTDWHESSGMAKMAEVLQDKTARQLYLPSEVDEDSECGQAVQRLYDGILEGELWAYKMVDSWGKNTDGAMYGNYKYFGQYDECVTQVTPDEAFQGKYCTIRTFKSSESTRASDGNWTTGGELDARTWLPPRQLRPRTVVVSNINRDIQVTYSNCMPSVCSKEQMQASLDQVMTGSPLHARVIACYEDKKLPLSRPDVTFICCMSVLLTVVLAATCLDLYITTTKQPRLAKGGLRLLLAFSVYTNMGKLFGMNTNPSSATISCLHAMRVMSMIWVIWCHQYGSTFFWTANLLAPAKRLNNLAVQIVLNGYPSVDTFFFLSGLLVSYGVLREARKTGTLAYGMYFAHRMMRLLPAMGLVAWLYATIVRHFVNGPFSIYWTLFQNGCKENWWKDMLFIDNFLGDEGECLGQAWYVAVDTQLYIVAPIMILPLFFFKEKGKMWLFVVSVAAIVIPGAITYVNDLPPTVLLDDPSSDDVMPLVYMMPWCRAGPYLVGIWLGYIIHSQANTKVIMRPLTVVVGWTLSTATALLVLFGIWSYNTTPPIAQYDGVTAVTYAALNRPAWGAALAWVVYACHYGYGGVVNGFLSHPVWQPLSRLTYTIYLVALPMQYVIVLNTRVPFYFTHLNKMVETLGAMFISTVVAVVVTLLAESPFISLERMLLRPGHGEPGGATRPVPQVSGQTDVVPESTPAPDQTNLSPDHTTPDQTKLPPDHTILSLALEPQPEAHDNAAFSLASEKAYPPIVTNGKDVPLVTVYNTEIFSNESSSKATRF